MRFGIFSKFDMAGGSERRCVEMANALVRHTPHQARLLCERDFPDRLREGVDERVDLQVNVLAPSPGRPELFYDLDCLLVVNTDSQEFCRRDYWRGNTSRHQVGVDLTRIRQAVFLFNFIVSPSRRLAEIEVDCPRLKIITANRKFLDEIGKQSRYRAVRHIPRMMLESPIDPSRIDPQKRPADVVRIGMHSTPNQDKWNREWPELIAEVNRRRPAASIGWRFMGMPDDLRGAVSSFSNVEAVAAHARPVSDFLRELDVFAFFTSWKREEPWGRSTAEALMSGCPVVATPRGGNRDQIVSGNNGLLCESREEFADAIALLVESASLRRSMGRLARRMAGDFTSESVIHRFVRFVDDTPWAAEENRG
ncbi:MAG: glycosyltransferase family 4 protein [Pirellulaceae bacterium]